MMQLSRWVCSALLVLSLASCNNGTTQTGPIVTVATDAVFPPFEYLGANGTISGFDIDLFNAIADNQNFKVVFYNVEFNQLFKQLKTGEAQVVISALSITPERQKTMLFSDSYFLIKQLILVTSNNRANTLKDLAGQRIGVVSDTTSEAFVVQTLNKNKKNIVRFKDIEKMGQAFRSNKLDAMISDEYAIKAYMKKNPLLAVRAISDESAPVAQSGIAMYKKEDAHILMNKINDGLRNVKANGTYEKLYRKHFD